MDYNFVKPIDILSDINRRELCLGMTKIKFQCSIASYLHNFYLIALMCIEIRSNEERMIDKLIDRQTD